jgi:HD-GYP domain-containing protein (c-di-GMP phosphodiesterase class II)
MNTKMPLSPVIADPEAFQDFVDSLIDLVPVFEHNVGLLRKTPDDRAVIADLFRTVHNLKGDAALCKFELAGRIAHPIESLLSRLRDGTLKFSDLLGEVILLALDRLELSVDALIAQKPLDNLKLEELINGLNALAEAGNAEMVDRAVAVVEAVTGFHPSTLAAPPSTRDIVVAGSEDKATRDLRFFEQLALQFESRSPLFKGRSARLLRLAEDTNDAAGQPVDPIQLQAAVYMHDLGMMFLPESVWLKVEKLSDEDKAVLRSHPTLGAELLSRMPGWEAAAEMIAQHHEMPDGSGYPAALKNDKICAGAKILAIIDAFEAVTLKHSHRGHSRSILRAIAEVNACDNQFAQEWITPFNAVIRRQIEAA